MKKLLMILTLTLPLAASFTFAAEDDLQASLRGPMFNDAKAALERANKERAVVLAPTIYGKAGAAYLKAEEIFDDGGKLDRIQGLLADAEELFDEAATVSVRIRARISDAYQARLDAQEAGAKDAASKLWTDAEENFFDAVRRLESDRERGVDRYAEKATEGYREAELAAIEVSLFTEIENSIERAKDADADDYAPESLQRAQSLLDQARSELARDRYDTDRPRDLANTALHDARRAEYVSALVKRLRREDAAVESELLMWQNEIRAIAADLDSAVYFDDGPKAAAAEVRARIVDLQQSMARSQADYDQARDHIVALDQEVERLQNELGGESRARERLNQELARQQQQRERMQRMEALFAPGEAEVFRSQERLIIRLVGLTFASGQASLAPEHDEILAKVRGALAEFPQAPVIVEGHTDSFGADLSNLDLSKRRANAVIEFLLNSGSVSAANVSAVGYGETQPIANNETQEGRRKNRRIDLVLYPQW
ncbi:MAG: OmpA family protein [Pseudomonadaceae bacterium]|nr:OmpA family protein [Pseudomonadaceae bacterium]